MHKKRNLIPSTYLNMAIGGGFLYLIYKILSSKTTEKVAKIFFDIYNDAKETSEDIGQYIGEFVGKYIKSSGRIDLPRSNIIIEEIEQKIGREEYITNQDLRTLIQTYKADEFNRTRDWATLAANILMPISMLISTPKFKTNLTDENFKKARNIISLVKNNKIKVVNLMDLTLSKLVEKQNKYGLTMDAKGWIKYQVEFTERCKKLGTYEKRKEQLLSRKGLAIAKKMSLY